MKEFDQNLGNKDQAQLTRNADACPTPCLSHLDSSLLRVAICLQGSLKARRMPLLRVASCRAAMFVYDSPTNLY